MTEAFMTELQAALSRNASFNELVQIICGYRDAGLTQRGAYEVLVALRGRMLELMGEQVEDRVLELMDIVTGFCQPHSRLWKDPLHP